MSSSRLWAWNLSRSLASLLCRSFMRWASSITMYCQSTCASSQGSGCTASPPAHRTMPCECCHGAQSSQRVGRALWTWSGLACCEPLMHCSALDIAGDLPVHLHTCDRLQSCWAWAAKADSTPACLALAGSSATASCAARPPLCTANPLLLPSPCVINKCRPGPGHRGQDSWLKCPRRQWLASSATSSTYTLDLLCYPPPTAPASAQPAAGGHPEPKTLHPKP